MKAIDKAINICDNSPEEREMEDYKKQLAVLIKDLDKEAAVRKIEEILSHVKAINSHRSK